MWTLVECVLTCLTMEKAYSYWGHSHVGTQYFGVKITGTHGQEIASLHIQSCLSAIFVWTSAVQRSRRCLNSDGVHSWQDGIVLEACNNKQLTQLSEICPISSSVSLYIYTHSSSSSRVYFQTASMSLCRTYLSVCAVCTDVLKHGYICITREHTEHRSV